MFNFVVVKKTSHCFQAKSTTEDFRLRTSTVTPNFFFILFETNWKASFDTFTMFRTFHQQMGELPIYALNIMPKKETLSQLVLRYCQQNFEA
jgi:hypothetical protein